MMTGRIPNDFHQLSADEWRLICDLRSWPAESRAKMFSCMTSATEAWKYGEAVERAKRAESKAAFTVIVGGLSA